MAIYHCSIKIISRGKGKSAVAAAAYRAGEKITNEYDGIVHDFTRKGGVVHTEILLPNHVPKEYEERAVLWNAVEKIEKAKNSQLAREIELALPTELTREQNISLVREYVKSIFVSAGMCADICVHDKNGENPHAHILLTMRPIEPDGNWGAKAHKVNGKKIPTVDWNEQTKAEQWRAAWAVAVNAVLEQHGIVERVDHRSLERQGIERAPTVHLGVASAQMERRGVVTERGNVNREIIITNRHLRQLRARINQLENWLKEESRNATQSTLVDIVREILERGQQRNGYGQTRELKTLERVFNYLQKNNISTLPELRKQFGEIQERFGSVRDNLIFYERQINVLDENIRQAEIYKQNKALYMEYQQIKPRKQAAFYEANRAELMLFEAAERHLKDCAISSSNTPLKPWKEERAELVAEYNKMYAEYAVLKEQVLDVENVRMTVEQIIRKMNRKEPEKGARRTTWER